MLSAVVVALEVAVVVAVVVTDVVIVLVTDVVGVTNAQSWNVPVPSS